MNVQNFFLQTLTQFWFIIPFLLFVAVISSPWFKGVFGEYLVNKLLTSLPETDYTLITRINEIKMKPSLVTDYRHRKHVKKLVATKETEVSNPTCPRCGSTMIVRETKKGTNAGKKFLGCSEFPKCRGMSKFE